MRRTIGVCDYVEELRAGGFSAEVFGELLRAFQEALRQHPFTPADGFSPDQEFFVAWGQFRGDETRPETQRRMIQGDPHPVAKYRVVGPLSNLPAFQRAFSCGETSAMVRPAGKRCEVW